MEATCSVCGSPLGAHPRDVRFSWPDPVLDSGVDLDGGEVWMAGPAVQESDLLAVRSVGCFVRALLPVALEHGQIVTFGVWVGVSPEDFQRAVDGWHTLDYAQMRFDGLLANRIPPWDVIGSPIRIEVIDPSRRPWSTSSPDPTLGRLLSEVQHVEELVPFLPPQVAQGLHG
jgi:hypothetical protein